MTAVFMGLLAPDFERACKDSTLVMQVLSEWEARLDDYEKETGDRVSGQTRIAVLARWSPDAMRPTILNCVPQVQNDYQNLRAMLQAYTFSTAEFNAAGILAPSRGKNASQATPMEIGAITGGGKAHDNKGKGTHGKGYGGYGAKGSDKFGKGGKDGTNIFRWKRRQALRQQG